MLFHSTRGASAAVGLSEAIRNGVAGDGGLYIPQAMPRATLESLHPGMELSSFAAQLLAPFFAGDALEAELGAICAESYNFPATLITPDPAKPTLRALELFHGPTGAFKDFGARFLMGCFDRMGDPDHRLTILAATSGDTGAAVGCASEGRSGMRTLILYPKGRVSPFQELQLSCWNTPVEALEVAGDFDDCQRLVKAAFADPSLVAAHRLSSANSINVGRWLPQMAYLAATAVDLYAATGTRPGFIIPTGNLGHGFAALYARAMGLPIGPVVLATNANPTLREWAETGEYLPRPSLATLANAMDVGAPSNFERVSHLSPEHREVTVEQVDDHAIAARIKVDHDAGYLWCPHSATAAEAFARLDEQRRTERTWVAAATAHPFKFAEIIQPLIGEMLVPPPPLRLLLSRPARKVSIPATLDALSRQITASRELARN
jgi:threonine synthase